MRLKSGKLAFVQEQSSEDVKRPTVRVFFSLTSNLPVTPYDLKLLQSNDFIASYESADSWKLPESRRVEILGIDQA